MSKKKDYNRTDLIIFGSLTAAEKKAYKQKGFDQVVVEPRPGFDSGHGPCGNHLCHCTGHCQNDINTL
jgi:hypothetical protein